MNQSQSVIKDKDGLDITDPYICEQQKVIGNVSYTGDKNNLNPVNLKIKRLFNTNSYTSNPTIDGNGYYESDVSNIKEGNYQVEYSISDKYGKSASGSYTFEKKDVCDDGLPVIKNSKSSFGLTRTGGLENSFVLALAFLILFMFVSSQINGFKIKD